MVNKQNMKTIQIKDIPDKVFYDTCKLKATLKAGTWLDWLKKVNERLKDVKK